jgi:hypothetical protein
MIAPWKYMTKFNLRKTKNFKLLENKPWKWNLSN